MLEPVESGTVLVTLMEPREPPVVQVAAVRGLAEIDYHPGNLWRELPEANFTSRFSRNVKVRPSGLIS